jgi:hypothetical protein
MKIVSDLRLNYNVRINTVLHLYVLCLYESSGFFMLKKTFVATWV